MHFLRRIMIWRPVLLFCCLTLANPARADELADFAAAAETAQAHYRIALGHLRTENIDLAALEIERTKEAWSALLSAKPPAVFAGTELYAVTTTDISTRLVTAQMMLGLGRPDVARNALMPIRAELTKLRRSGGIVVLADCIADANAVMDGFFVYGTRDLDWTREEIRTGLAAKAGSYAEALTRCDAMAPASVRADGQFRWLIGGALASLAFIPKAIETRDSDLLHRVLGELRSFDDLLAFRYG
jgi:hypothetical protein